MPSILTKRQTEAAMLSMRGMMNKEAANALGISCKTFEKHRQEVFKKLNVDSVLAMCRVMLRLKIITLEEFLESQMGEERAHGTSVAPSLSKLTETKFFH